MIRTTESAQHWRIRMLPNDLGVALVLLVALALALLLRSQVEGRTTTFQAQDLPFSIAYPAGWSTSEEEGRLLFASDPLTPSTFKTQLSVESALLDPASPPTLQTLIDRRVDERDDLTAYYLMGQEETTVDGAPAHYLEYAYVVQPIDTPGRPALPVVVHAREYIVQTPDSAYYITLAAPADAFEAASAQFDRIMQTVNVQ